MDGSVNKVFMTADTVGGVWHYALELSRGLGAHGVQVALATMGGCLSADQRAEAEAIPNLEVFDSRYKLAWMEDPWGDVQEAGPWLLDLVAQVRPAVVHLNDYVHGTLPWPAPVLMVGHSCVLSWWEAVRGRQAPGDWLRYRGAVGRGLRAADLVAAPTLAMLEALERYYGPLPNRRVIPNGRSPDRWQPGVKEPLILAAGRLWDEAKNLAALAAVAPRLPWPVCVAGEDRHPDGGRSLLPNVRLLGRLAPDDLAGWLARAAIYALPARYEPFGLSALEAALAGCALVLGDIPSLREVWGEAALFVPPDDPEALENALHALIADPALRRRHARLARARAARFTPEAMADAYLDAYQSLLRARSAGVRQVGVGIHDLPWAVGRP
ncbi:MAG: glycosyltransferase family 4 protein [Pseudomonadota bacterium]|nr:glycosyltransferase family 4 protein [Pseudomonadota bacterium]